MAEFKNQFSWSFSAAEDFETCRRRRYWSKYGMWGGWARNAEPWRKTAYRLAKMDNRWGLMGQAAEEAVMWVLRRHQQGLPAADAAAAWEQVAKPFLARKWAESREGKWREDPKHYCCLREHYYQTMADENAEKRQIAAQVKNCIDHFIVRVLPRIGAVAPAQEIPVASPGLGGDVEHFLHEGVKIYAIPDYAYRHGDQVHIHDWKAGKVKAGPHRRQLSVYALWAIARQHAARPEDIFLYVEYLNEAQVLPFQPTADDLAETVASIGASVGEMAEYLVDCDRGRNEPLPKEEWELAADPASCSQCNFYELCRRELEAPF